MNILIFKTQTTDLQATTNLHLVKEYVCMLYREKQRNERQPLLCNSPRRLLPKKFLVFHTYALNTMLFVEILVKKIMLFAVFSHICMIKNSKETD